MTSGGDRCIASSSSRPSAATYKSVNRMRWLICAAATMFDAFSGGVSVIGGLPSTAG